MRTLGFLRPMIVTVDSGNDANFTITTSLSTDYDINIVETTLEGNTGTTLEITYLK